MAPRSTGSSRRAPRSSRHQDDRGRFQIPNWPPHTGRRPISLQRKPRNRRTLLPRPAPPRPRARGALVLMINRLGPWCVRLRATIGADQHPARQLRGLGCPSCGARTVSVVDDEGQQVRQPPMVLTFDETGQPAKAGCTAARRSMSASRACSSWPTARATCRTRRRRHDSNNRIPSACCTGAWPPRRGKSFEYCLPAARAASGAPRRAPSSARGAATHAPK